MAQNQDANVYAELMKGFLLFVELAAVVVAEALILRLVHPVPLFRPRWRGRHRLNT